MCPNKQLSQESTGGGLGEEEGDDDDVDDEESPPRNVPFHVSPVRIVSTASCFCPERRGCSAVYRDVPEPCAVRVCS